MSLFLTRKKILKDIKTLVIKDGWNDQLFLVILKYPSLAMQRLMLYSLKVIKL